MRSTPILALAAMLLGTTYVDGQQELLGIDYQTGQLWTLDTTTGAVGNPRATGLTGFVGIAGSPDGTLYGLMGHYGPTPNSLWTIDPATGASTLVGPTGISPIEEGGLAFDPISGQLYGVGWHWPSGTFLFRLDPLTATATGVGQLPMGVEVSGLSFDSSGTLYGFHSQDGLFAQFDKETAGVISVLHTEITFGPLAGLAIHPRTSEVWAVDGGFGAWRNLVRFNMLNSDAEVVGPIGLPGYLSGMTFFEPILATATFRNDSQGTNPLGYVASPPVIGSTWTCSVDDTALAHAWIGVVGYHFPDERYLPVADDYVLVNTHPLLPEVLNLLPQPGSAVVPFSIPIPDAIHLYGLPVSTQAYGWGGPAGVTLFNAYDLVLGG